MTTVVTEFPAAPPATALAHFEALMAFEADCWDVHHAMTAQVADFVLLDVRSPSLFATGHVPGALNLPHGKMTERRMAEWPEGTLFVVYCAGPHCNAANKAALALAKLSRPTKELIGGMTGWADEGFAYASGDAPGHINEVEQ